MISTRPNYHSSNKKNAKLWLGRLYQYRYWLIGAACLFYVVSINGVATQGYVLADLQTQLKQSQTTTDELRLQITALQALPRLESEATVLALTQQPGIDFLVPAGTIVASR